MKVKDLKKLIIESINEVDFEDNITIALDNIETWARNAKRQIANKRDPQIFYRLVKAIADKATVLLEDPDMDEGYGSGLGDPKAARKGTRWTLRYPSDNDWKKNKKSLSKVYENMSSTSQDEKREVQIYKAIGLIAVNLIKLHEDPDYDESEEIRLHRELKQMMDKLHDVFQASPVFRRYE